jgi:hypothetical protein
MKTSVSMLFFFLSVMPALGGCKQDPPAPSAQPAGRAAKPTAKVDHGDHGDHKAAWGTATVNSPPGNDGSPRRGIVRESADFNAPEVTRLNNGTQLTVIDAPSNGWHHVSWPPGEDTSEGYIHGDVLSVRPNQ